MFNLGEFAIAKQTFPGPKLSYGTFFGQYRSGWHDRHALAAQRVYVMSVGRYPALPVIFAKRWDTRLVTDDSAMLNHAAQYCLPVPNSLGEQIWHVVN